MIPLITIIVPPHRRPGHGGPDRRDGLRHSRHRRAVRALDLQVNDFSMIIGTTMLFSVFFVASYLIQDILYGIIDPRIRVAGNRE